MPRPVPRAAASARVSSRPLAVALALALVPGAAPALELGFEGYLALIGSDNVEAVNDPDEEEGVIGSGLLGVYGETRTRSVHGAFTGEIDARRRLDEDGGSTDDAITRFLGAAEIALTARALRWYVGDILGGVRVDDAIQPISDNAESVRRRNVLVTGPSFETELGRNRRLSSRLLYVNQTEDERELETLFNATLDISQEVIRGSVFGLSVADVYTDAPEDDGESDFNRLSASAYWTRERGFLETHARLGATRYDTDSESLDGLAAELRATRALGPASSATIRLTRDLSDQTLSTVESLIDDGAGVEPEAEGFFDDTRLELGYLLKAERTSAELGVGAGRRDYRLLTGSDDADFDADDQDQVQSYAYGAYTRALTPRLRTELAARYERQSYDERDEESDSVLGAVRLLYRLSRSFELEGGYVFERAQGSRRRVLDGALVAEPIDATENRVVLGLRWAPPSRASRDLTIELKSLLP